jgi:hypothetical protein
VVAVSLKQNERLLAAYPNAIAGMKDSSGDWNNTRTFLDAFVRDRHETSSKSQNPSSKSQGRSKIQHSKGEAALDARRGDNVDTHETSSKSQTPSSKSQGSFKIQHSKGEAAFGARRGGHVDNDGSFGVFVGSESFLLANMWNGGAGDFRDPTSTRPPFTSFTNFRIQIADSEKVCRQIECRASGV